VAGVYNATTTVTHSGTATEPITFISNLAMTPDGKASASASMGEIHLSGASNIQIRNLHALKVVVSGGSGITLAHDDTSLHVTNGAANVTALDSRLGGLVVVDGGSADTVLTTNEIGGVSIVGATDTAVTGNTLSGCGPAISVTDTASGTRLENNIMDDPSAACATLYPYGLTEVISAT